jgi:broad specificity phosphatase PhoE
VTETTLVHVVRHGEVDNPEGLLYGRLPGYHLSELGQQMADVVAKHLADRDITYVVSSPLERALETAAPIAASHHLEIAKDARLIEAENHFQGLRFGVGDGSLRHPRHWPKLINPTRPSWGEAYKEQAVRMLGAVESAKDQARGHEAVCVSHQLPIWTLRSFLEGRRLWHDPRKRECSLASVTTVHFEDDRVVAVTYEQPARALLPEPSPHTPPAGA